MVRDDETRLAEVVGAVGEPPRGIFSGLRREGKSKPPEWVKPEDLVSRIFEHHSKILKNGVVRWAAVIHANKTLLRPGVTRSGGQVVYAPGGDAPLAALRKIAQRAYMLKGAKPRDRELLPLARMLTDERERALDWVVPASLTGGAKVITTLVIMPREHMLARMLALMWFPVVADPETSMAVMIPERFWPEDLRREWIAQAEQVPIARITPAAALRLRYDAKGQAPVVELKFKPVGTTHYQYAFSIVPPGTPCVEARTSQGIRVQIADEYTLARVEEGTVIDYKDDGYSIGHANQEQRPG